MSAGLIVRGVTFAENLQRLSEADGDVCPDNKPVDFTSRWAIYTFVRTSRFETAPRHEAATRRDHAVKSARPVCAA